MWKFLRAIFPMELPRDSNRDLRTVTWSIHRQTCRWNRRQKESVGDSIGKSEYITTLLTLPSPISPSSSPSQLSPPKLQTTTPQKKSPSTQHKSYFFKFCGHNIRVLIYCGFYHFL